MMTNNINEIITELELINERLENLFREIKQIKLQKSDIEDKMKDLETEIEVKVAFDETLKNERQRNAQKQQLLKLDIDYQKLKQELRNLEIALIEVEAEFMKQKNKFKYLNSLLKILGENYD